MKRVTIILMLLLIGGSFSACTAAKRQTLLKEGLEAAKNYVVTEIIPKVGDIAKEEAGKAVEALEKKRVEKRDANQKKMDEKLADLKPDLAYDTNEDGKVTVSDFDQDGDKELGFLESFALVNYYRSQEPQEGKEKDTGGFLLLAGIAVALYGGSKLKKNFDKKRKSAVNS